MFSISDSHLSHEISVIILIAAFLGTFVVYKLKKRKQQCNQGTVLVCMEQADTVLFSQKA